MRGKHSGNSASGGGETRDRRTNSLRQVNIASMAKSSTKEPIENLALALPLIRIFFYFSTAARGSGNVQKEIGVSAPPHIEKKRKTPAGKQIWGVGWVLLEMLTIGRLKTKKAGLEVPSRSNGGPPLVSNHSISSHLHLQGLGTTEKGPQKPKEI